MVQALFGVKSTITTTAGVGPALEAEFRAGPLGSFATMSSETESIGYSVVTTPIAAPAGAPTPFKIDARSEYFGTTPSEFSETIAIFTDAGGTVVNGTEAPLFSMIVPVPRATTARVSGQYSTYCYTPGDIHSYGQTRIDETMANFYRSLSDGDKELFGDFKNGYERGYIDKVIIPNAHTFRSGRKYVEFTVGSSGLTVPTIQSIDQFVVTTGTAIKGRLYAGVGAAMKFSFFGLFDIEGVSASLLTGFDVEAAITRGIGGTESWGIVFTSTPNAPSAVSGALSYSVRLYLCRPSNLWARELQFFAPAVAEKPNVDFESSMPSKIMFVVSNIARTLEPRQSSS
jgi:hypothetical protein